MREIFTSGVPREEMGAKMTGLRDAFQEDLKAFLTEEQLAKYKEIRNQRPQGGRGSGGFGGGDRKVDGSGRSSGSPEVLKLTDDQKTKWTEASTKQRDGMREIFTSGIPREQRREVLWSHVAMDFKTRPSVDQLISVIDSNLK